MKIIIAAQIKVDSAKREKALLQAAPVIAQTLKEPGCLAYNWAADGIDNELITVFEEWQSEETLDLHFTTDNFKKMHSILADCGLLSASATKYAVHQEGPVFNSDGVATSEF